VSSVLMVLTGFTGPVACVEGCLVDSGISAGRVDRNEFASSDNRPSVISILLVETVLFVCPHDVHRLPGVMKRRHSSHVAVITSIH